MQIAVELKKKFKLDKLLQKIMLAVAINTNFHVNPLLKVSLLILCKSNF